MRAPRTTKPTLTTREELALSIIDNKSNWEPPRVAEIERILGIGDGEGHKVFQSLERKGLAVKVGTRWYSKRNAPATEEYHGEPQ